MVNDRQSEGGPEGKTKNLKRSRSEVIEISSDEEGPPTVDQHRSKKIPALDTSSSIPLTGSSSSKTKPISSSSTSSSSLLLENKPERFKLEYERLARQRARELASGSTHSPSSPSFKPYTITPTTPTFPIHAPVLQEPSGSFQNYWNSTIKVTYNDWYPDSPNALKIEDIIGPKDRVKMALVSSYVLEIPWVHKLFDPHTRIMVIRHHTECGMFKVNERQNMFLCHPPMLKTANGTARHGCMHIKFFIIFYDNFCRVAIPTANAVSFDYEFVENAVWIQDFPRFDGNTVGFNSRKSDDDVPPFRKTLDDLLERMGVPAPFRKPLEDHDFRTAAANLVVSVQGSHPSNSAFGQTRLANELETLGLQSGPGTGRTATLECQGSSIGSYDPKWIKNFYSCASGSPPTTTTMTMTMSGSTESEPKTQTNSSLPPLSVLYPSLHTVRNSKSGRGGGGTLFCNKATWEKPGFPSQIFADTMSKRSGVLMHVKMILGIFNYSVESTGPTASTSTREVEKRINKDQVGFLYVGSHNLTPAAWGKFTSKSASNETGSLEISNWEMGVVLPLKSQAQVEEYVTWQRPVKPYGHGGKDTGIPWMQFSHGR
ncbi:hypothetical protein PSTG_15185 [Puccinia striiformis f. sp. tritici PST-78]|uniref:PLD phosphodiesterase domain-containing protein n=1 Tax=Puccinia striiformis f. sp. tritici PST-78 TaxID=1165861 RepID=A0A0L0UWH7_9BASI|nr:hypothetical protein PSTG_15185 [Puccinia striiformis f. sp. tritici PST-78]